MPNLQSPQQNYGIYNSQHADPDWASRELTSITLNQAYSAFTMQDTHPDGYKFMKACDEVTNFLDLAIPLEDSEQRVLIQVLQAACTMHDNAVNNNPRLSKVQRSAHQLASVNLTVVCKKALDYGILLPGLQHEAMSLNSFAEQARAKATEELDLSKYLDNFPSDNGAGPSVAPSPMPAFATSGLSAHNISDPRQASRSAGLKEKVHATLSAKLNSPTQFPPLGRAYSMPHLLQSATTDTQTGRANAHHQGYGHHALEGIQE